MEENKFDIVAYKLKEELEEIFKKPLVDVIRGNIKIDGKKTALFGNGMKDEDDHIFQQKLLQVRAKIKR